MGTVGVLILALATLGGSAPAATTGRVTVVVIRSTSGPLGRMLVDGQGRTL